jgi:hypothetical protein
LECITDPRNREEEILVLSSRMNKQRPYDLFSVAVYDAVEIWFDHFPLVT